jgi:hypothetical protein
MKMWYIYTMEYYFSIKRMKLCHLQQQDEIVPELSHILNVLICRILKNQVDRRREWGSEEGEMRG